MQAMKLDTTMKGLNNTFRLLGVGFAIPQIIRAGR
jgi:hypothetical protein